MADGRRQFADRGPRNVRGPLVVCAALAALIALAGCGGSGSPGGAANTSGGRPGASRPVVTLGTKNFTEQFVLGQLYKQALEAKGYRVRLKNDIGSSEIVDRALVGGAIDLYPEYTGVIVTEIAKEKLRLTSPRDTYERAKAFEARRGFAVLEPSPGSDVLATGVLPAYARKHGLKSTGDLIKVGRFTYGGAPENRTRFQGAVGMERVYRLHKLVYVPIRIEDRYRALDSGRVDAIGVFSTEPELAETGRYTVLSDPKGIFGFQNIVPVVRQSVLARAGEPFRQTLDAITTKLTSQALREMNAEVDLRGRPPAVVARAFLQRNGLI